MKSKFIYRLFGLVLCLHLAVYGNAQQIMHFEYYFDSIPQSGQGTIIPITPTDSFSGNLSISTAGLQPGKHLLYIRALDSNNNYSLYYANWIFVESPILIDADAWEWFTDVDPGQGQANIQTITPVDSLNSFLAIQTNSIPAGSQLLKVRVRSSPGLWSHYYISHIAIAHDSSAVMLTGLEYFIGPDSGAGKGAQIGFTPIDSLKSSFVIQTDSMPTGAQLLKLRGRSSQGTWSHYSISHLAIDPDSTSLMLTGLEYFIGPDPGTGNAVQIGLSPAPTIDLDVIALTDTLSLGNYMLGMRAKNEIGVWSHVFTRPFAICTMFGPKADFDWKVERNQVYFTNQSEYIQRAEWAFGNGSSDTLQLNPAHTYIPGVYNVCMIAKNVCGRDTVCNEIVVPGIAKMFPSVHANDGICFADVYGANIEPGSDIRLFRAGYPDIPAIYDSFIDHTRIQSIFAFRAHAIGFYHLEITRPGGMKDTLLNAIELVPDTGHDLWIDMPGPERLLVGRNYDFNILVGNKGTRTAFGVPIYVKARPGTTILPHGLALQDSVPLWVYDSIPFFYYWEDHNLDDTVVIGTFIFPKIRPGEIVNLSLRLKHTAIGAKPIEYFLLPPQYEDWEIDSVFRAGCGIPPCLRCALDLAGIIPGVGCATGAITLLCDIAEGGSSPFSLGLSAAATIGSCWNPSGLLLGLTAQVIGAAAASSSAGASSSCGPGGCNPKPKKPKPQNSVGSLDPNIKIGPTGFSSENYTRGDHPFVYTVYFENADTATAPANEVRVIDTLDKAIFDLSTLQFISFGFGDTSMTVLESIDPAAFVRDIDLRPARNTIVRVQGSLDTATGVLTAYYASYDPDTMRLVYDPFDGFLPPNVNAPEGEGFIQFMIGLKPGMQHLDRIENEAAIYFDANAPIVTPMWLNTIDLEAPTSTVDALPIEVFDTSFTVTWSGTDAHAGVMDYDIYVIEDDTLEYLWKNGIRKTTATFTGSYGRTYKFYSIARDNAGNEELPPADPVLMPDAFTTLKPTGIHRPAPGDVAANLYPNPANQSVQVEIELLQPESLSIRISHLHGTVVDERHLGTATPGVHRSTFNLAAYPAGVYLVEVRAGERHKVLKLVVQQ